MKIKYFTLPNILTLSNLLCGVVATLLAISHIWSPAEAPLTLPILFTLASAIFDFLDGFAARLTGQYSPLGVQLDSLADMVSFGVTPSVVLVAMFNDAQGEGWWWLICLGVALCSALRLARFNIDEEQKESFIGLPTPALAIAIGSLAWAMQTGSIVLSPSHILAISVVGAWLLISPIRMFSFKFKTFALKENAVRLGFATLALTCFIVGGVGTLWVVILLYILTSLIIQLTSTIKTNRERRA